MLTVSNIWLMNMEWATPKKRKQARLAVGHRRLLWACHVHRTNLFHSNWSNEYKFNQELQYKIVKRWLSKLFLGNTSSATFDEYRIPFNAFFSTQLGWEFNSECFLEKFPPLISQSNRNCPTSAVNTMFRSLDPISDPAVIDGILAHVSAHRLECECVWLNWSKEKLMKRYG